MAKLRWVALPGLRALHPGSFAFVMATGIISIAEQSYGSPTISALLLLAAILGYLILCALFVMRLLRYRSEFWADTERPQRAFGFFTFVAGSNVLAARLQLAGWTGWAIALAIIGSLAWLVIVYLVPLRVVLGRTKPDIGDAVNGTWLIWVVGTQSVAIAFVELGGRVALPADATALCAVSLWAFGAVLYIVLMAVITGRLMLERLDPVQATPPYWITMGATAITVLAGAQLLGLDRSLPLSQATRAGLSAVTFFLWAFGTWWFPFMIVLTCWRYARLERPAYEQTLWSMVFPLGMYSVATETYARVARVYLLSVVARNEIWLALIAWLLVAGWMVISWFRPAWPSSARQVAAPEAFRRA